MSQDYNKNINPSHYTKGISVQEFNYSHDRNDLAGNCIKYLARYDVKNPEDPLEDLYKCKQCLETLIDFIESDIEINKLTVEKIQKVIDNQDRQNMDKFFPKINE
tara:strand:+ start:1179 stop:1493 length:315 start_codon:yes stop_codon:yes gene_type:complete